VTDNQVLWMAEEHGTRRFPKLDSDATVDVAIVGGGIVGLAAAHLLAGRLRVTVLEGARIGHQATGRSTAKVTSQHGPVYRQMVDDIGEDGARAYGLANERALEWIVNMSGGRAERADAYVYADSRRAGEELREEAEVARRLGLPASFVADAGIPLENHGALVFTGQAQINPFVFLGDLATALEGRAEVYEHTRIVEIEHGAPCILRTAHGRTIRARWVIVATQIPTIGEGNFFAKVYPHAHAVIAARIGAADVPDGMYISADQPTRSFRRAQVGGVDYIVATGGSYRPGEREAQARDFAALEQFILDHFGIGTVDYRWTNEDFRPMDRLPFVGPATSKSPELLVATGFNAWGLTTGVAAAQILAERVQGREHPLAPFLDATRLRPLKGGAAFIAGNVEAGVQMTKDRVLKTRIEELDGIKAGEGGVVKHEGRQVAVSRDAAGNVTAVSAICTHLGCVVAWNPVERTWDCACHGSRFSARGEVLAGPAVKPLEAVSFPGDAGDAGHPAQDPTER
jgi:glycine/D-amino acid oxidase-like deaminating enzyme/nitrite reductase/ring-hydroxylating ferredoxin subunit